MSSETLLDHDAHIVWVGRFTGPKGVIGRALIHDVFAALSNCRCSMIGGPDHLLPNTYPAHIDIYGQCNERTVRRMLRAADIVIGSGRTAIDAVLLHKPTFALGEAGYLGRVTRATLSICKASNFGDCGHEVPIDYRAVCADVRTCIANAPTIDVTASDMADYDGDAVANSVLALYTRAIRAQRTTS